MNIKTGLSVLFLALALGGCSVPVETISYDPAIRTTVTVYPLYDVRADKAVDLSKISPNPSLRTAFLNEAYLAKFKNVLTKPAAQPGAESPVPEEEFDSGKWVERAEFSGASGRYCLLTYLSDLRFTSANASVVASMRLYLLDCEKKEVVWRKSSFHEEWMGLVGGSMERLMSSRGDNPAWKCFSAALTDAVQAMPYMKKEASSLAVGG